MTASSAFIDKSLKCFFCSAGPAGWWCGAWAGPPPPVSTSHTSPAQTYRVRSVNGLEKQYQHLYLYFSVSRNKSSKFPKLQPRPLQSLRDEEVQPSPGRSQSQDSLQDESHRHHRELRPGERPPPPPAQPAFAPRHGPAGQESAGSSCAGQQWGEGWAGWGPGGGPAEENQLSHHLRSSQALGPRLPRETPRAETTTQVGGV